MGKEDLERWMNMLIKEYEKDKDKFLDNLMQTYFIVGDTTGRYCLRLDFVDFTKDKFSKHYSKGE